MAVAEAVSVAVGAGGKVTVTVAEPDLVVSCTDTAVMVAVLAPADAVKRPDVLTVPVLAGLTVHVTAELKLPVPWTLAVHCEVCPV